VEISVAIRDIDSIHLKKKRLIDKMRGTVERLQSLEREAGRLERRADVAKGDVAAEARKELRTRRTELKDIEEASESRAHGTEAHADFHSPRRSRSRARPRRN